MLCWLSRSAFGGRTARHPRQRIGLHSTASRPGAGDVAKAGGRPYPGYGTEGGTMAEARVVLFVGASGAAATRIAERAAATAGFEAVGLSRRTPPGGAGDWIAADLLDAAGLARALSAR